MNEKEKKRNKHEKQASNYFSNLTLAVQFDACSLKKTYQILYRHDFHNRLKNLNNVGRNFINSTRVLHKSLKGIKEKGIIPVEYVGHQLSKKKKT